jgi:hypothetical protein
MEIRTASQAIDALGGTARVSRMFDPVLSYRVISNWRLPARGLPPDSYYVLAPRLRRRGHVFTPLLFAQKLPAARPVPRRSNGHKQPSPA